MVKFLIQFELSYFIVLRSYSLSDLVTRSKRLAFLASSIDSGEAFFLRQEALKGTLAVRLMRF